MVDFAAVVKEETEKPKVNFNTAIKKQTSMDKALAGLAGQKELGEPGLKSSMARFNLARADNLKEKMNLFRQQYPEGELIEAPVTNELLFREDPSKPFSKVEGPEFEPINDVIDFLGGDVGPLAGELAMTVGTRGLNLLPTMFRMFAGGAGGELAEQGVQTAEGVQEQSLQEVGSQALATGTVSGTFGAAGYGAGKLFDIARGGGALGLKEGVPEAMSAMADLEAKTGIKIPAFTPGQASDSPLVQKIEGQAGATMPTIQRYIDTQNKASLKILDRIKGEGSPELLRGELDKAHGLARSEIIGLMKNPKVDLTKGGEAVKRGIAKYDETSRYIVNEAYKKAREIQGAEFDLSQLRQASAEVGQGVRGLSAEGEEIMLSGRQSPELASVIQDIQNLDPNLPEVILENGEKIGAVEQLRALRSRLWDLKTPPPGEIRRQEHFQASRIYGEITNTLNNPVNKDPAFRAAWKKANDEAAKRFSTMDKVLVIQSAKHESPAILAHNFAKPRQVDNIRTLREIMPNEDFKEFQGSFKTGLIEKADDITKTLDSFDKPTLNILLSPGERAMFRKIGKDIDRLNSTGIQKVLDRQSRAGSIIKDLLYKNDTGSVDKIGAVVRKNPNSKASKEIRSGLIDAIANDVVKDGTINAKALTQSLSILEDRGLRQFLTNNDIFMLRNLEKIAPFLKSKTDTGTSIAGAEAASGFRGVLTGDVSGAAVRTVLEHIGIGRVFTGPVGKFLLTGTGKEYNARKITSLMGATIGTALIDMEGQKE